MQQIIPALWSKSLPLVLSASTTFLCAVSAQADEAYAIATLDKMSDYLGAQTAIAFDFQATLDIITEDDQKLSIASTGSIELGRPDKLHVKRSGGFAAVEFSFDGQVLTALNVDEKIYGQVEIPGTVENLIDTLREEYAFPLPAADVLVKDFSSLMKPLMTDVKDLGTGIIDGTVCDHFAFRTEEVDLQIWIATGDAPFPCRYTITNKTITGWPDYQFDVSNWRTGPTEITGSLSLPEGASRAEIDAVPNLDELAGIYSSEGNK